MTRVMNLPISSIAAQQRQAQGSSPSACPIRLRLN